MKIAMIGCGAVGRSLMELIQADSDLNIAAIVVPTKFIAAAQEVAGQLQLAVEVSSSVPEKDIDLVVEVAGHSAIEEHVLPVLRRGVPAIVVSIGALSTKDLPERLEAAAREGKTQIQLISGAIGAMDALAAARIGGLESVHYIGRKPPHAWTGTPADTAHDLASLDTATVIFEGSAREAARLYPKNANVAATISMAGVGLDKTVVRLIADPAVSKNIHRVEARGAFGEFELTLRNNTLPANPKTSALTVYSAVRALRNRVAALAI